MSETFIVARLNGTDITLMVSLKDRQNFDALPPGESNLHVTMWDEKTAGHYIVSRAGCGAGCYCAAKAFPVLHGSQVSTTDTEEEIEQRRNDALDEIYSDRKK